MPVLERTGRSVRLTEAGTVLARHAQAVATALDAAAGEIAELQGLRSGRVRIAAFPSASATIVPRLLAAMAERHPAVTISYLEAEPPEAVAAVRENRADIALTFSYPGDRDDPHRESARGLSVRTVGTRAGARRAARTRIRRPLRHPSTSPPSPARAGSPDARAAAATWSSSATPSGYVPRIGYETDNFVAVLSMVAAGLGVATLPRLALASTRLPDGSRRPADHARRPPHAARRDRRGCRAGAGHRGEPAGARRHRPQRMDRRAAHDRSARHRMPLARLEGDV